MSTTLDALEKNAKALLDLTNAIVGENAQLVRENRKLHDQLDDALDALAELRSRVNELEMLAARGAA